MADKERPPTDFPHPSQSHDHRDISSSTTCLKCGGPTSYPIPPPPSSSIPTYIPIRFPAVNLPPNPTNTKEAIIRTPVPQAQRVAPLEPPYCFQTLIKIISSQDDVVRFHSSSTLANFLGFVVSLSEAIKSHKLSDPCHVSPAISSLVGVIEKVAVKLIPHPFSSVIIRSQWRSDYQNIDSMVYSDDEDEGLPTEVSEYYFVDSNNESISFGELPLKWDDAKSSDSKIKEIGLRGSIDNGLQQFFTQVTAWKFDISCVPKPEILVLTPKNNWIKLLKPKKSYEEIIRTILITVHCLNYVKKNPETSEKALWDNLAKVFSLYEPRPSERDLVGHLDLVSEAVERHEELKTSKVLVAFMEDKPIGKKVFSKEFGVPAMSSFIVDDVYDEEAEIDEDDSNDEGEDFFEHVCAICDNGGDILCCEGKCLRSFHATKESGSESNCDSLGYSAEQVKAMQTFECKNCQFKRHQCFVCGKLGSSDKSADAEVFQCVTGTCGYFYHPNCVAKALQFKFGDEVKDLERRIGEGASFMCPIHFCSVCHELEPEDKNDKKMQFAVCRRCPKAYHRKCLPRTIAFEYDEDKGIEQRAWEELMPNKILIYCLNHEIQYELSTPSRNHIKFPDTLPKKEKQTSEVVCKEKVVPRKRVNFLEDSARAKTASKQSKAFVKSSSAVNKTDSIKTNEGQLFMGEMPKKGILCDKSGEAFKKRLSRKDNKSTEGGSMASSGEQLYAYYKKDSDAVKPKGKGGPIIKDFNKSVKLKPDSERRIHSILREAESSITLEDVIEKHKPPSTLGSSSKQILQNMQNMRNMTLGKVEGSVEAIRAALQKLDGGGNLEDAKAVCEPGLLNQITKFRTKMKVYLSPFLYGPRYTSFGRHFTNPEKLQAIVDKLHWYMKDGDMMVDFSCGANDFSWLMKQKLDEVGKSCNFKNYDILPAKNNFNFEQKDWMEVQPSDLPPGPQLIIGLNPPFGVQAVLAKKFIDKALKFKPKLLILIVPRDTERLDVKNPYDLIWEDDELLRGKAFYLPGSIDVNEKQMDDWNVCAPPLYLWSRQDWTIKHKEIALQQGHLPGAEEIQKCHLQRQLSGQHGEPFDLCLQDVKKLQAKVEKATEIHVEGSRLSGEDKKSPKDRGQKDQASGDCSEENKKKRKRGAVSDKKSPGKRSVPRHLSPKARGRSWDLPNRSEMPLRTEVKREGYQSVEHASVSGSQLHMERGYGSYPDDRMARWNGMNNEEHYFGVGNRRQHPVDPGSDFRARPSAEPFMDYTRHPTDIASQFYGREADMSLEAQFYGHQRPAFVTHAGNHLPGPPLGFSSTYMQLGATTDPAYNAVNTSAMERYRPRLDESNALTRMNNMGPMQHLDGTWGTHNPPRHGPGGYPLEFAHGPYPPFSQRSSSGWLNE